MIAFDAAPGTLAGDEQGPYGVFGKTLAGAMRQGGVDVVEVFDQTRVTVNQLTQGALLPWSASKLTEPYYIFERAADAPPPAVATAVTNQPIAGLPADAAYAAALQRDTIRGYEEYLSHFPDSAQAPLRHRQQHHPAVRRKPAAIKCGCDFLALDGWKREERDRNVGHGGHGGRESAQG